jgi:hypothetical protein
MRLARRRDGFEVVIADDFVPQYRALGYAIHDAPASSPVPVEEHGPMGSSVAGTTSVSSTPTADGPNPDSPAPRRRAGRASAGGS